MKVYTVMYAILGHNGVFEVKINSNEQVSGLKNKLVTSNPILAHLNVSNITLFKVNKPAPNNEGDYDKVLKSIALCTIDFNKEQKLWNSFVKLSTIPDGFPESTLHLLLEIPASESFG